MTGHSIATPQRTWNQYFGYDSANRLRLAMELSAGAPANPSSGSCTDAQGTWTGEEWRQQLGFDGFGNAWSVWLNGHWDPKAQGHSESPNRPTLP